MCCCDSSVEPVSSLPGHPELICRDGPEERIGQDPSEELCEGGRKPLCGDLGVTGNGLCMVELKVPCMPSGWRHSRAVTKSRRSGTEVCRAGDS